MVIVLVLWDGLEVHGKGNVQPNEVVVSVYRICKRDESISVHSTEEAYC